MDKTNKNIIEVLNEQGYSGYIMINTYSKIDPKGSSLNDFANDEDNIKISRFLLNLFKTKIIACSVSNYINLNYFNKVLSKYDFEAFYEQDKIISHFSDPGLIRFKGIKNINKPEIVEISIKSKRKKEEFNRCMVSIKKK